MCIIVLSSAEIRSPSCDVRDNESLLLELLHVLVGRGPHAQPVIRMVDEMYLSVVGQR